MEQTEGMDLGALGRSIARRREARGWSSHRLSEKAEVADPHLRKVEAGTVVVGIDVLARIAKALDTTVVDLLHAASLEGQQRERTTIEQKRIFLRQGTALTESDIESLSLMIQTLDDERDRLIRERDSG